MRDIFTVDFFYFRAMILDKERFEQGMTFNDYKSLFEKLVENNSTTGNDQSQEMVNYTKLNLQRTERVIKTTHINADLEKALQKNNLALNWLIITEPWCGDAAQSVAAFDFFSKVNPNIKLRLFLRDENEDLMNQFLTNGTKSIPVVVFMDNEMNAIAHWGPRPKLAQDMVLEYKKNPTKEKMAFYADMHAWYAKDRTHEIQKEIAELLNSL